jgi:hypothetical protein
LATPNPLAFGWIEETHFDSVTWFGMPKTNIIENKKYNLQTVFVEEILLNFGNPANTN